MQSTHLFVYGTLRHDQPEHARFCRGVTDWSPARVRAQLWLLAAGYRLATVTEGAVLLTATPDATVDERQRGALTEDAIATAARAAEAAGAPWLEGEVLCFRDAAEAWPPLDRWEEFTPGRSTGSYTRAVVPTEYSENIKAVWMYVATEPPVGAKSIGVPRASW